MFGFTSSTVIWKEKKNNAAAASRSSGKVSARPFVCFEALWTVWEQDVHSWQWLNGSI